MGVRLYMICKRNRDVCVERIRLSSRAKKLVLSLISRILNSNGTLDVIIVHGVKQSLNITAHVQLGA